MGSSGVLPRIGGGRLFSVILYHVAARTRPRASAVRSFSRRPNVPTRVPPNEKPGSTREPGLVKRRGPGVFQRGTSCPPYFLGGYAGATASRHYAQHLRLEQSAQPHVSYDRSARPRTR